MSSIKDYFSSLFNGAWSLVQGMQVTGKELVTPKITKQYPENRETLDIPERFRATLKLVYDSEGNHKCIACGLCQMNCPNGTIHIESKMVELPDGLSGVLKIDFPKNKQVVAAIQSGEEVPTFK